jgi:hypothetical protein
VEALEDDIKREGSAELARMRATADADAQQLLAAMALACRQEQQAAVDALVKVSSVYHHCVHIIKRDAASVPTLLPSPPCRSWLMHGLSK